MDLRWYQKQAIKAVFDYLRTTSGSPLVVLPTGSGKTPVIAALTQQVVKWGGRVLICAHVKELLQQSAEKLQLFLNKEDIGIYSAGLNERTTTTPVIVAGIQSIYANAEDLGVFNMVIVDEAHTIPPTGCGRYRTLIESEKRLNPNVRLVGLTATPFRLGCGWISKDRVDENDNRDYDRLFDNIVYEISVDKLISDGTLSSVWSKGTNAAPDFGSVHITRGDYDETEIEKVLNGRGVLERICAEIAEQTRDRNKVVIFCNRCESAKKCAKLLQDLDQEHLAAYVDGETTALERADLVTAFKSEVGKETLLGTEKPIKYLCNVGVFTTGFDAPNVDCVCLLRPTQSVSLYHQMIGRGLRKHENKKDCLVLDFGGNIERLGPIDLPRVTVDKVNKEKRYKMCKYCKSFVRVGYKTCPICEQEFEIATQPKTNPNNGLKAKASNASILSNGKEEFENTDVVNVYDVTGIEFEIHHKRNAEEGTPPTLMIKYKIGQFRRPIYEFLCASHTGYARRKFEKWWRDKSKTDPPKDVETAFEYATNGALASVTRIKTTLKSGSNFPAVEWIEHGEKPDFDAQTIELNDFEKDFNDFSENYDNIPF